MSVSNCVASMMLVTGCLHALGIAIGTVHRWMWGQKFLHRWRSGCHGWCFLYVEGGGMKTTHKSRLPLYAFLVFVLVMAAVPAEAHVNTTCMGSIYDGLMHFVMSPEDFVPVLARALMAGLCGAAHGRRALFVLPVGWLLGA